MTHLSRRDLIRNAALLSCAGSSVAGCVRRISPAREIAAPAPVDGDVAVSLSSAPELERAGGAVVVRPAGLSGSFLLVNGGTGFFALDAVCPHEGCHLTWVPE